MNFKLLPTYSSKFELEQNIFHFVQIIASTLCLVLSLLGFAIGADLASTLIVLFCSFFYAFVYWLSRYGKRYKTAAIIYLITTLISCSFSWQLVGGINGTMPQIYVFISVLIILAVPKSLKMVSAILLFSNVSTLIFLDLNYPEWLYDYNEPPEIARMGKGMTILFSFIAIYIIVIFVRNKYERERDLTKAQNSALRQATKAKSQFLANMSHEIRTPMNGVIGMTELLGQTELNEEQKDYLNTIQLSGQRLLAIINEVLDLSKIEAGAMQLKEAPFSLEKCVQESVAISRPKIGEKKIQLSYQLSPLLPEFVVADAGKVRQMLLNLLDNAIKFTEEGSIDIFLEAIPSSKKEKLLIQISVKDSGCGVAEEKQNLLFKEFSQIDASSTRKYGGTGLGLAIVSKLSNLMGGRAGMESQEGLGSSFFFSFLAEAASNGSIPTKEVVKQEVLNSKKTHKKYEILLVEDDKINQKLILRIFSKLGYQCQLAENGLQAVQISQQQNFDLIFMDMHMPEMDGLEATSKILEYADHNNRPTPIIIAMTANALEEDKQRCFAVGMRDFLSKPISTKEIQQTVEKWTKLLD
jgi:signal transduction histidine kinase/ActR/RegA family two-component response regulator